MKSKVKFSAFCIGITSIVIIAVIVGIIVSLDNIKDAVILFAVLVGMILSSLFYCPISIEADSDNLKIHRVLKTKSFDYNRIAHLDRCYPSGGGLRLCGSGGFMGYWVYFSDIVIGTYFGYYGTHTQCILIRLTDGKQYVVSCQNPDEMVAEINRRCGKQI